MKQFLLPLLLTAALMSGLVAPVNAVDSGGMIMVRSTESFPEAMSLLQEAIRKQGYQLSRVQRVDIGLTAKGYKTDKYRIVFLGKGDEIIDITSRYPDLTPYLPLKIAIFAEEDSTLLVTVNPVVYRDMFKLPELAPVFERWQKDLKSILNAVQIQN